MKTLVRIGDEFNQAISDSANETAVYQNRIAQLEHQNREVRSTENEAAQQQLRRVKRVMKALLEEIGGSCPDSPASNDGSPRWEIPQLRALGSPLPSPRAESNTALLGSHGVSSQCMSPPNSSPRSTSSRSRTTRLLKSSDLGPDLEWRMATNRTPKTAEVVCPIPWKWLQQRLGLNEDMVSSTKALTTFRALN
ncbi:hypothetical protein V8B97DRAFT_1924070 [Scleroderma yunnanense]